MEITSVFLLRYVFILFSLFGYKRIAHCLHIWCDARIPSTQREIFSSDPFPEIYSFIIDCTITAGFFGVTHSPNRGI